MVVEKGFSLTRVFITVYLPKNLFIVTDNDCWLVQDHRNEAITTDKVRAGIGEKTPEMIQEIAEVEIATKRRTLATEALGLIMIKAETVEKTATVTETLHRRIRARGGRRLWAADWGTESRREHGLKLMI